MKFSLLIVVFSLLIITTSSFAEDKVITLPFPDSNIDLNTHNLFCNATLGTTLKARSNNHSLVKQGVAKAEISSRAFEATDKLVLQIIDTKLFLFKQDEFESGKTNNNFPLKIIENSKTNLVAIASGLISPKGATVVTLNRGTGIGTWTTVLSMGYLSDSPRVEAYYFTCGAKE